MRPTQIEAKAVMITSRRENTRNMIDIAYGLFAGIIITGLLFALAQILTFICEVPRQLKRIADELERIADEVKQRNR